MKNNIVKFGAIAAVAVMLSACSGSGVKDGKDTAGDNNDQRSQTDTSQVTTTTGDASNLDNSGSGGTKTAKDSVLMDSTKSPNNQ